LLFFTGGAVIIWVVWLSLQTGWPAQPAINVSRLAPGYVPIMELGHTLLAFAATAIWCKLILWRLGKNPRFIWKSLVLPASGALLCWVLLMTLWMPLLNYARSYKPLAIQVKSLVKEPKCIYALGLNRAQIAGLSFHGNFNFDNFKTNAKRNDCNWLITNPETLAKQSSAINTDVWKKTKLIRRPADKREDIVIFKKVTNVANE
jgi:hypothetical protein